MYNVQEISIRGKDRFPRKNIVLTHKFTYIIIWYDLTGISLTMLTNFYSNVAFKSIIKTLLLRKFQPSSRLNNLSALSI